jgi:hypothetical protein
MNEVYGATCDALKVYAIAAAVSFAVAGIIWLLNRAIHSANKKRGDS